MDTTSFDSAVNALSPRLRQILESLAPEIKSSAYEIRLRANMPVTLTGKYGTVFITEEAICSGKFSSDCVCAKKDEIRDTFSRICSYSIHSFQRFINSGYIPMNGGNRAGICGTAVCEQGNITNIKDISSINIRISRQIKGCGEQIVKDIENNMKSIIIAGPPNSGKTTILRDVVRSLSSGAGGIYRKIAVCDERREISGVFQGEATNDMGFCCDILDSYPKAQAVDIAVRTLSPDVIACDEVSSKEEIEAISRGANSGVKFIVTAHAGSRSELINRPQIRELMETYSFEKLYLLDNAHNIGKIKEIYDVRELIHEIYLRVPDSFGLPADRSL